MAVLTKPDIVKAITSRSVIISWSGHVLDVSDLEIGPNSIDLHLHRSFVVYESDKLRVGYHNEVRSFDIEEGFVLEPGTLYLARTIEQTFTPNHVPKVWGRSSMGRLGLSIHQTAGFGDVGFCGTWTLELSVVQPLEIMPGMRIAQLELNTLSSPVAEEDQYNGRYQDQTGPREYKP